MFKRNIDFESILCKPLSHSEYRVAESTDKDLQLAAKLEHEAFSIYGTTRVHARFQRLKIWHQTDKNFIFFMLHEGEVVGYSAIFPISELDAKRCRAGLLKEFGLDPKQPGSPPTFFYAQAIYLRRDLQGHKDCRVCRNGSSSSTSPLIIQTECFAHSVYWQILKLGMALDSS